MSKQATKVWMGAALAMMLGADVAMAQTASKDEPKGQPAGTPMPTMQPKRVRSVRKPVVDLDAMAKDRRPGQVMPGDPAPMGGMAMKPMSEGVPAGGAEAAEGGKPVAPMASVQGSVKPTIKLPDTAPWNKPVLRPMGDNAARPEVLNGTLPEPVAEVVVESAPATRVPQAGASAVPVAVVAPVVAAPMVENIEPKPAEKQVEKPVEKMVERPQVAGVTLVDGVVLTQVPMALSTGGASVRLESISGDGAGVQWRVGDGPWTTPSAGQTADGRVEVRAGLDAQAVLVVDGTAQLRVSRLGRATIERCAEPRAASSVSVQVLRGAVEIRPLGEAAATGQMFARVRTPDQGFGLTGPLRVEYDAFTGTRRRVVNP